MKRALLSVLGLTFVLGGCVLTGDPCVDEDCPADRICAVLEGQPRCLCADPAVEVDGSCVVEEEAGAGEGEGE